MATLRPPVSADPVAGSHPLSSTRPSPKDDIERRSSGSLSSDRHSDKDGLIVDADAQEGAKQTEAASAVWPAWGKVVFGIGLALTAYLYQLDNTTTYLYLAYATSAFGHHSLLAAVQVCQAIVIAVAKPPIAKLSDVWGRAEAYLFAIVFYTIGYIVIAASQSVGDLCGGIVLYAIGGTGIQILNVILIGDMTTMRWRGFVTGCLYLPFLINGFVASNIGNAILADSGWRWGYGMFAIILPPCSAVIIVTLFWGQHRARKQGLVPPRKRWDLKPRAVGGSLSRFASAIDLGGALLFTAGIALILLAITLAKNAPQNWNSAHIIVMLVIGPLCLIAVAPYERFVAAKPFIPGSYLRNWTVMMCVVIGIFDFLGFYVSNTYLYSFMVVTRGWSVKDTGYFLYAQSMTATVSGILAGVLMYFFRRYKYLTIIGACLRVLGLGLMIRYRGVNNSVFELVIVQIIQGWGGGFISGTIQVACQFSVKHTSLATVTALVLLFTEVGGAAGTAIAGAIWTQDMPAALARHYPGATDADVQRLFGSIAVPPAFGTVERTAMIDAYSDVMRKMIIIATALSSPMIIAAIFLKEHYLSDAHNEVEGKNLGATHIVDENAPAAQVTQTRSARVTPSEQENIAEGKEKA